jgi:diguanylate cyclase (GGDEF)-like protein
MSASAPPARQALEQRRSGWWVAPDVALYDAGAAGEVVAAKGRIAIILALTSIPVIGFMRGVVSQGVVALIVGAVALGLAWLVLVAARRRMWRSWLGFASSLTDISVVSALHAISVVNGMPSLAVNGRTAFPIYLLAVAATALRFDARITILTGVVGAVQYSVIAAWALSVWTDPNTTDSRIYGLYDPIAQGGKVLEILIMTVLTVVVVRQTARLRLASTHDGLTGLLNRAYFDERFDEEIARSRRTKESFAIAVIDVDHFKQVNDQWGHSAGDSALKSVANRLRDSVRRTDIVARYGGEEFTLMLERATVGEAITLLNNMRAAVAEHDIPVSNGDAPIRVTMSAGIAVFPDDGETADALMGAADRRLLEAKRTGRNRIVHSGT